MLKSIFLAVVFLTALPGCDESEEKKDKKTQGTPNDQGQDEEGTDKDPGTDPKDEKKLNAMFGLAGGPNSYQTTTEAWAQLIKAAKDSGGSFIHLQPMGWGEAETAPGVFNFSDFDALHSQLSESGLSYTLDIGTPVGINQVDLPADLLFSSFSDPTMLDRYKKYVAANLEKFPSPAYVVLHTETASRFLEDDKPSWEAYCKLLADTADYIRGIAPKAKVGVYITSYDTAEEVALMTKNMDYFSFGYNADKGDLDHKAEIEKMFALAGDRQVGIHEIGIPTSPVVKGSTEKQVAFVNLIFDLATSWGKKLEFMAYYQGFDEDPAVTSVWLPAAFPDWSEQMKTEGIAWFGSLGLQTYDAKPKPAWETFKQRIKSYNESVVVPVK